MCKALGCGYWRTVGICGQQKKVAQDLIQFRRSFMLDLSKNCIDSPPPVPDLGTPPPCLVLVDVMHEVHVQF